MLPGHCVEMDAVGKTETNSDVRNQSHNSWGGEYLGFFVAFMGLVTVIFGGLHYQASVLSNELLRR